MILWTDPIIFVQPFSGDNKDYVTYDDEKLSIRIREEKSHRWKVCIYKWNTLK